MSSSCKLNNDNYVGQHLPPAVIRRLEAGAFQSLCEHLRERSDEVPNIDLMTVSGFCRNCLSKVRSYFACAFDLQLGALL